MYIYIISNINVCGKRNIQNIVALVWCCWFNVLMLLFKRKRREKRKTTKRYIILSSKHTCLIKINTFWVWAYLHCYLYSLFLGSQLAQASLTNSNACMLFFDYSLLFPHFVFLKRFLNYKKCCCYSLLLLSDPCDIAIAFISTDLDHVHLLTLCECFLVF